MSFYAHMRSCLQMSIVSGQRVGKIMPFPYTQRYVYVVCACVTLAAGVYLVPSDVEFCTRGGRRLAWNFAPGEQANDFNTPRAGGPEEGFAGGVESAVDLCVENAVDFVWRKSPKSQTRHRRVLWDKSRVQNST